MNTEAINGAIKVGDVVLVNSIVEYGCMVGTVTAIDSAEENDTGNPFDDIHVDLLNSEYSDWRKLEIEKHFEGLTGNRVSFAELPLDDVIMPPDWLIRVTDCTHSEFAEMLSSYDNAKAFGDSFQARYFDDLENRLLERIEQNYTDYNKSLLSFGSRELIDMAAAIHAHSDCWSYLTSYHAFSDEELKFLIQFDNPLEIVSEQWRKSNIDVGEVQFALDFIMEPERQRDALKEYSLYEPPKPAPRDTVVPPKEQSPLEQLYDKMADEFEDFLADLKIKPAQEIVGASYEKVFKEDLLLTVGNEMDCDGFSDAKANALLALDRPLEHLYNCWLDSDVSYMDLLRDLVDNEADFLVSENQKAQVQPQVEQSKPQPPKQQQKSAPREPDTLLGEAFAAAREVEARKAAQPAHTKSTKKEIDTL